MKLYSSRTRYFAACAVIIGALLAAGCVTSEQTTNETAAQKGEKTVVEKKKRRPGNVITAEEIRSRPTATLAELIVGRITGVYNAGGGSLLIRGPSTIYGSNEPLYVMDGVPLVNQPSINTADIETIEVLKGPDAALYGVRGANGVIVITTKRQN